jgi:isopenicillin N synthase-like dioxygenase
VSSVTTLPVVDLRDSPGQLRQRLREAAHEVGFFYLIGHNVPAVLTARVLAAAQRLFALPQANKDAVAMLRSPHFRGYTRLGGELTRGEVDWREQIDIGPERSPIGGPGKPDYLWLQGPNQWPSGVPELPGIVAEWDAALAAVARGLLRHWAVSLGSAADAFDAAFADAPATLIKIVHYPPVTASSQGVGAHRDSGVLTLLLAEPGSEGLQVWAARGGGWVDVPGRDGAFVVNIGELLEVASNGYLRATEHRVNLQRSADRISALLLQSPTRRAVPCPDAAGGTRGARRPARGPR